LLIYPDIDPVAFRLGPLAVHWYGLMYALGFAAAAAWLHHQRERFGLDRDAVGDLLFAGILGVIVGGRLGYVIFYQPAAFLSDPLAVLAVWQGGMSFHGGVLGVLVALAWFARRQGMPLLTVGDYVLPVVPIGLGLGRLGNFINGELWGRVASPELPWAMVFRHVDAHPRHPSQLYELLLEGVVLFLLVAGYARRRPARGRVVGLFLAGYGVARFGVEYFRAPDPFLGELALGWTMGQWLSVPMILAGVWLLLRPVPPLGGQGEG
jgi:phosphatidylglycerol:prolipoprotein diacylglycerol transferase